MIIEPVTSHNVLAH